MIIFLNDGLIDLMEHFDIEVMLNFFYRMKKKKGVLIE
jgi:hypothetical protein